MTEPSAGRLVVLDGIDGAGKSSVAAGLVRKLDDIGMNAVFVSRMQEATTATATSRLRSLSNLLWGYGDDDLAPLGDRHLILLMASWFALFDTSVIRPALLHSQIVITDQSPRKYIARFLTKGHQNVEDLFSGLRSADLVLFLDINAEEAAARKNTLRSTECGGSGTASAASFAIFQERVRTELLEMQGANCTSIDASHDFDKVVAAATAATCAALGTIFEES